jgi:subtilisin family serine protease
MNPKEWIMKSHSSQLLPIVAMLLAALALIGISVPMASAAPKVPPVIVHVKDASKVDGLSQKHGFSIDKSLVRGPERTLIIHHPDPVGLSKRLEKDGDVAWVEIDHPLHRLDGGETVLPLDGGETALPLGTTVASLGPVDSSTTGQTISSLLGTTVTPAQQSVIASSYAILASLITPSERLLIQPGLLKISLYQSVSLARGRGAKVAVIDTGLDTCHEALQGIAVYSFVSTPNAENCPTPGAPQPPGFGHGTAVSSLIRAVAPEASISMFQVFDDTGTAHVSTVYEAVLFATNQGANVINMSFGTSTPFRR